MIANQMAGLLGHPVSECPRCVGYAGYHGPELISILSNVTWMFQVPWPSKCTLVNGSAGYNVVCVLMKGSDAKGDIPIRTGICRWKALFNCAQLSINFFCCIYGFLHNFYKYL